MPIYHLKTPLSDRDVEPLRVGDTLYISGIVVAARDSAHRRILEAGPPIDLKGGVIYHAGPVARRGPAGWEIISMGPTTSARMEAFQAEVIEKFGVKLVVGKGGMGKKTAEAMKKHVAAYAIFTGGAGVLAAKTIRRVVDVYWLDLGMAEAMWVLEMENFGPLTVMIDPTGRNYYEEAREEARRKISEIL
ncbi:MAG: FumA C-terminus/TtdB family hydratase beta subunit [Pyrobaculum sp.]